MRLRFIHVWLIVLVAAAVQSHAQKRDSSYVIEGIVKDPELTRPERWAHVQIVNKKIFLQADSNGYFSFSNLWPDTFVVGTYYYDSVSPASLCTVSVALTSERRRIFLYLAMLGAYDTEGNRYRDRPEGWHRINADNRFSFSLPSDFKKTEGIFGVDSYVEEYTRMDMRVSFDYGMGVSFSKTLQDGKTKVFVGCKKAIISRYYYPESKSPRKLVHAIDFYWPRLTLWVEYTYSFQEDDALRILYSVRVP